VPERAAFYFDLASPYAYLAAERISGLFTEAELEQPEWRPILAGALMKEFGRTPWGLTDERGANLAEIERPGSPHARRSGPTACGPVLSSVPRPGSAATPAARARLR